MSQENVSLIQRVYEEYGRTGEVVRWALQYERVGSTQYQRAALQLSEWASMGDWRMLFLYRDRIRTVVGDHDVFGDATVVLRSLPGHTPGHQGLLVDLGDSGPILLATDIAYSARDYADAAIRTSNVDLDQSRSSIETAKRIEREFGAKAA